MHFTVDTIEAMKHYTIHDLSSSLMSDANFMFTFMSISLQIFIETKMQFYDFATTYCLYIAYCTLYDLQYRHCH